ncbi:MAG TPA: FAD/NAD(P)-binding oxidoreductase [Dehalococcoidia bacterium]|nr:FAD/NAD(P)-binding oxidoreductase [Dehalococcoidia bacterium]
MGNVWQLPLASLLLDSMAMADPVVLVLGCGIGGVSAARELRRLLPSSHRVIVIDRDAQASFPPSYLWVMTGERRPEAIRRRRSLLSRKGIEFVNADVREIDLDAKYVRAESREFHYDYLILALGAETSLDTTPGLAEAGHSFYTMDGVERLAASLRYFAGGRVVIAVAGLPFKCPPAPYEAAMLLEHHFHSRRIRQKVEIELYTPEQRPIAVAGEENGEAVMGLLAHRGIAFHPGKRLTSVDPVKREALFEDGSSAPFQLLIAVPEHRAPAVVRDTGLTNETGWVPVDPETLETRVSGVFAVGDITTFPLPDGMQLPKAGVFAEKQAIVAARNIAFRLAGGPRPDPFDGQGRCFLEVGAGAAGIAEGNFLAPQRRIDLKQPSIIWHWAKLAFERYWLWRAYG